MSWVLWTASGSSDPDSLATAKGHPKENLKPPKAVGPGMLASPGHSLQSTSSRRPGPGIAGGVWVSPALQRGPCLGAAGQGLQVSWGTQKRLWRKHELELGMK